MTKVKFDAIDPRILPEMSAKVSFLSQDVTAEQQKPMVAVATDAVVQRDGRAVVFVIKDGVATAVPVTTGKKVGDLTGIAGDVKSGDKVVQKPAENLAVRRAGEGREVASRGAAHSTWSPTMPTESADPIRGRGRRQPRPCRWSPSAT